MIRAHGYVTVSAPDAQVMERDAITCAHCGQIVLVKPGTVSTVYLLPQLAGPMREEMGAGCRQCGKPVCLQCCDIGTCVPMEKRIELMEAIGARG